MFAFFIRFIAHRHVMCLCFFIFVVLVNAHAIAIECTHLYWNYAREMNCQWHIKGKERMERLIAAITITRNGSEEILAIYIKENGEVRFEFELILIWLLIIQSLRIRKIELFQKWHLTGLRNYVLVSFNKQVKWNINIMCSGFKSKNIEGEDWQ